MSGIAGLVTFDGSPADPAAAERMAAAAPHRGADGLLSWAGPGAALAYQRTLVLADRGDERGLVELDGLVCLADARLDNRDELVAALVRSGTLPVDPARPAGDAEVILAAYRRWGQGCPARLVGDFAFVVWDTRDRTLFAARDPLAMRSLSYHVRPGRSLAFATEVKQLLVFDEVPRRINERAVLGDLVATFGRPDWSFYDGIANVAPGHMLIADGQNVRTERYWAPDPSFRLWLDDEADYAQLLRDRLMDAVAARLRTRRPAGILLSGGVDSGSVAASAASLIAADAVPAPALHAFCWAFDRLPQCDERAVSRLIVEHFGFSATDIPADDAGPLAGYPEHGPDRDDPFLGAFQPLIEHSLEAARAAGAGVVLGGDRGDLLFGTTGWSFLRLALGGRPRDAVSELAEYRRATADGWGTIVRRQLIDGLTARLGRRARRWLPRPGTRPGGAAAPPAEASAKEWLRPSPLLDEVLAANATDRPGGFGPARALRYDAIFTPLHVRGMAWSERTYARFGLAFADPFSDRRLVELSLAIPQVVINRPGDLSKPLVRAAMRGVMPEEARRRLDKVIPAPLFEQALRHEAAATIEQLVTAPRVAENGWVDGEAFRAAYDRWRAGVAPLPDEWWWTLGVEIWLRRYW